jgi:hypothetical protein
MIYVGRTLFVCAVTVLWFVALPISSAALFSGGKDTVIRAQRGAQSAVLWCVTSVRRFATLMGAVVENVSGAVITALTGFGWVTKALRRVANF